MIREINGDIVTNKDIKIFCNQIDCYGTGNKLSLRISKRYPEVDAKTYECINRYHKCPELLYGSNQAITCSDNRVCINMFSQFAPGSPTPKTIDNKSNRERAFDKCLAGLKYLIIPDILSTDRITIGFPKYIGCSTKSDNKWDKYRKMIINFDANVTSFAKKNNIELITYIINEELEEE